MYAGDVKSYIRRGNKKIEGKANRLSYKRNGEFCNAI